MTGNYFDKFPLIQYNGVTVPNITHRVGLLSAAYSDPLLYYPYDIQNHERPDHIANRYYKDPAMDWPLYIVNNIIDPYYQWYMDPDTFSEYITAKYGSVALAQQKIKKYRNNWYENPNPISISTFAALPSYLHRYYQPDFGPNPNSITVLQYIRRQEDWVMSTNAVVTYNIVGASGSFTIDEPLSIANAYGQVMFSNSSVLVAQHLSGNTSLTSGTITGQISGATTTITGFTPVSNNIPTAEISYWSPVTYYQNEVEINQQNKTIQVLKSQYIPQIASDLESLIN